jgi:hypothetical protein
VPVTPLPFTFDRNNLGLDPSVEKPLTRSTNFLPAEAALSSARLDGGWDFSASARRHDRSKRTDKPPERAQRRSRETDLNHKLGTNPAPLAITDPQTRRRAERDVSPGPSRPSRTPPPAPARTRHRARLHTERSRPPKSISRGIRCRSARCGIPRRGARSVGFRGFLRTLCRRSAAGSADRHP